MPKKTETRVDPPANDKKLAASVFQALQAGPIHIDGIQKEIGVPREELAAYLAELEIAGRVKQIMAGVYEWQEKPQTSQVSETSEVSGNPLTLRHIALDQLEPGPWQPRTHFDQEQLDELAASIRENGVLDPLKVRASFDSPHRYQIISGERRYRASLMAGLATVPCILAPLVAEDLALRREALLQNMHRADLRPLEEARALQQLAGDGMSQREIATALGKTQPWVSQRLGLLKLPDEALTALDNGVISVEDARTLVQFHNEPDLVRAIIEPRPKRGNPWGFWEGERIEQRVKNVQSRKDKERQRKEKLAALEAQCKKIAPDWEPYSGDVRYIDLSDKGNELTQAHDHFKLDCIAWGLNWNDRPVPLCDDPQRCREALKKMKASEDGLTPQQRAQLEEKRKIDAQRVARDETVQRWAKEPMSPYPTDWDYVILLRLDSLLSQNIDVFALVALWSGIPGNKKVRGEAVKEALKAGPAKEDHGRSWRRFYFLTEMAVTFVSAWRGSSHAWNWIRANGYIEPGSLVSMFKDVASPASPPDEPDVLDTLDLLIESKKDTDVFLHCGTCDYHSPPLTAYVAKMELQEDHAGHTVQIKVQKHGELEQASAEEDASGWCGDRGLCPECDRECNSRQTPPAAELEREEVPA